VAEQPFVSARRTRYRLERRDQCTKRRYAVSELTLRHPWQQPLSRLDEVLQRQAVALVAAAERVLRKNDEVYRRPG
jgi:hypothetical protein